MVANSRSPKLAQSRSPLRGRLKIFRMIAILFGVVVGLVLVEAGLRLMEKSSLVQDPGVINDPHNLSLRKAIMGYGVGHMCSEVQKRSVPLRLRPEDPSIGRFFVTARR